MIEVGEEIIGKKACVLHRSVASEAIVCKTDAITAYMVDCIEMKLRKKIRFKDGRWEDAECVFYPEDEAAERKKFEDQYGK